MTDTARRPNPESVLFVLAFGLAIVVRLLRLGELPLSDAEAHWAMQAVDLSRSLHPTIDPQPAYVLLTALAFYVFQAGNFTARLIPALFGSVLVLAPMLFRDRLGNKAALVLSFVLAIEPGLLAMSREAGSPIIAVSTILLAWGFWRRGNLRLAGVLAGVALLSGVFLWAGLIGLALAFGLSRGFFSTPEDGSDTQPAPFDRQALMTAGWFALGTYLVVGSMFLLAPGGLGAGLAAIPAYLAGWGNFSDVPASRLVAALAAYQPLGIILAVASLVRGIRNHERLVMSLGLWLLAALILALTYPSHQVADLAWMLIPLWTLASIEVARYLVPVEGNAWEALAMMGLTLAVLFFAGSNFVTIAISPIDMSAAGRQIGPVALTTGQVYWAVVLGALALLAASIALVAYSWSQPVAFQGSLWGILAALLIYTFSASTGAANLRTYRTTDLWSPGPQTIQADVLLGQMNDLSRWSKGVNQVLDVSVTGLDTTEHESYAIRWLLRDWRDATYSSEPTLTGTPAFVITPGDQAAAPQLTKAYRGQEFTWADNPDWNRMLPSDWLRWAILHTALPQEQKIILWTRGDIFVDAQNAPTP